MMEADLVTPALAADARGVEPYRALVGMATCQRLAVAFYARVEHDPVLRPLYPPTLKGCPTQHLAAFLAQFLGGPCDDARRRWTASLREAHLRFKIGPKEREAWLNAMAQAVDEVQIAEPARSALGWYFAQASAYFINQPPGAAAQSSRPSEIPVDDRTGLEPSSILQDIAQRWRMQRTLEEFVAAVRLGDADRALGLIGLPIVQLAFERDRGAFMSVLAILSGSGQPPLLEYVRRQLVADPGVGRERYAEDGWLLCQVAAQGSLPIVELLLHLGADPNAVDLSGHTPLYRVGNAAHGAQGVEIVRALVRGGADVNARERLRHCTALHMAARRGNIPVAAALLDCGADREARDKLGETPLHRAVKCGKTDFVAFLLSRGADAHAMGKSGLTPWQIARGETMKHLLPPPRA